MSSGSDGITNPIISAAISGLCAGLNTFLQSSQSLSAGNQADQNKVKAVGGPVDYDDVIEITETWTTNNFQNFFNYVFANNSSAPPNALENTTVVGFDEILVWGQTNYGEQVQIQAWINAQLADQVPIKLQPLLATELVNVLKFAFQQGDQNWLPQHKTLILPLSDGKATYYFDYVMLSSYAYDSNHQNPTGIARITGVLYYGPNNPTEQIS